MLGVFKVRREIKLTPVPYNGGTYSQTIAQPRTLAVSNIIKNILSTTNANKKINIEIALSSELTELPLPNPIPTPHYELTHLEKLKIIFKSMLEASYKSQDEAEDIGKGFALEMDRDLSNINTYVYFDMQTKFPLVVHRGSVDLINDWLVEDTLILTGLARLISPRVRLAKELVIKVEAKYKKFCDSFGHSMGARVSEESGAHGYILTYNKASGFGDIRKQTNPNQIDYRSPKDLVSLLSETQDTTIKYVGQDEGFINAHSLSILPEVQERRV